MKAQHLLTISSLLFLTACSSSGGSSSSTTTTTTGGVTQPAGTSTYAGDFSGTLVQDRSTIQGIGPGTYNLTGTTQASANFDTDKMSMQHMASGDGVEYSADYQDMRISGSTFIGSTQGRFNAEGNTRSFSSTIGTSGSFNPAFTELTGSSDTRTGFNNSTFTSNYTATKQ